MTQKRALLIVDCQVDFIEGGALGVDGGGHVAREVTALLANRPDRYDAVYASQDWHRPLPDLNGGHFAAEGTDPDYVSTWPVHCVAGTRGAALVPVLGQELSHLVSERRTVRYVRKGQGRPDYSAFQGRNPFGMQLLAWELGADGVTELDVVGIATDHCVRASALDALNLTRGVRLSEVRVLVDLVAGVDALASARALDEIGNQGGKLVLSTQL